MSRASDDFIHADPPGVGARVKKLRSKNQLSQRALAQEAGVHRSVISKLESGEIQHTTWLPQIAAALRTSALYLATGQAGENPSNNRATQSPKIDSLTLSQNQQAAHSGGVFFVQVITIGPDGKTPRLQNNYLGVAQQLLPAGITESTSICVAAVGHRHHVVAQLDTPLTDGMHALVTWRGAMVTCRVRFTERGYRLERPGAADELSVAAFTDQVQLVGRVLAVFMIEGD
jgi:transcriptional regulator with XRE-family HTH domain